MVEWISALEGSIAKIVKQLAGIDDSSSDSQHAKSSSSREKHRSSSSSKNRDTGSDWAKQVGVAERFRRDFVVGSEVRLST
jgi:hypothetical protein